MSLFMKLAKMNAVGGKRTMTVKTADGATVARITFSAPVTKVGMEGMTESARDGIRQGMKGGAVGEKGMGEDGGSAETGITSTVKGGRAAATVLAAVGRVQEALEALADADRAALDKADADAEDGRTDADGHDRATPVKQRKPRKAKDTGADAEAPALETATV